MRIFRLNEQHFRRPVLSGATALVALFAAVLLVTHARAQDYEWDVAEAEDFEDRDVPPWYAPSDWYDDIDEYEPHFYGFFDGNEDLFEYDEEEFWEDYDPGDEEPGDVDYPIDVGDIDVEDVYEEFDEIHVDADAVLEDDPGVLAGEGYTPEDYLDEGEYLGVPEEEYAEELFEEAESFRDLDFYDGDFGYYTNRWYDDDDKYGDWYD